MKTRAVTLIKKDLCYFVSILGFFIGTLLLALLPKSLLPIAPPIASAFLSDTPLLSLVADYAEEVKLLLPAALLPFALKSSLPAYPLLFLRGVYCGLSSAFFFLRGAFPIALVYLFLGIGVLYSHASALHCLLRALDLPKQKRLLPIHHFLFFSGALCLFVLLRNLAYMLF